MTVLRGARVYDLPGIERLLNDADLPTLGIAEHVGEFIVAEDRSALVACAGLETYGASALLRSVVVRPEYRSRGLGGRLVLQLLKTARHSGIRNVYLLTSTASEYFRRMGFEEVPRDQIDPSVQKSREFSAASCAPAKAMRLVEERTK